MRSHAARRLSERYGVHEGQDRLVARLRDLVLANGAKFRRPARDGCSEWEAYIDGRRVRFVWSEECRFVVTVLPARPRPRRMGTEP